MGNEMSENGVGPTPIPYDRGREVTEDMIAGRGRGENAGAARGGYGGASVGRGPVPGHGRGGGGGGGGGNQMGGNVVSGRGGPGAGVGRGGRGGTIGRGGGDSMGRWVGPTVGGSTVAVPTPPPPASAGPAFVIPGRGRGRGETRAHAPQPPHARGGGASSRSGDAGSRTKPAPWAAPAPGNVMEDDGPPEADLSHLTEEERAHILAVLSRAKDLQDKDEERVRILEDEFTKYTKDIKRRASDASSTADGAPKNLCPVCNRTELDESAIPGSAQEGLECQDCERPVCLQCGFYTPSIASQSRERRKKLERGASFSANEDGRKPRSTLHRGLSEQHSAPVGGLQHHPLTEVCSSSSCSLDPHSQQQQSPEGSSREYRHCYKNPFLCSFPEYRNYRKGLHLFLCVSSLDYDYNTNTPFVVV
ncbi:uncharacterized protein [Diadema antillarum]|uniref:uncharacterized protein n=1 Tax=Diadema antillarum TaxID=105358 RepID=UPI003A86C36C